MVVNQGDIFWAELGRPRNSAPAGTRPVLVVQSDLYNQTAIKTTVVVGLTTNPRRIRISGNVELRKGEANLPKTCVANVTHIITVDRRRLTKKIGTLPRERLEEVLDGVQLVLGRH